MSELDTRTEVVASRKEMMNNGAKGDAKEVFLTTCDEFGGLGLAHSLLMHEHAMRNNINASRFLGKVMEDDYTNAIRRVGKVMNRLEGKFNDYVSYRQVNQIKAGITNLYQEMTKWGIYLTPNGFSFPTEEVPTSE